MKRMVGLVIPVVTATTFLLAACAGVAPERAAIDSRAGLAVTSRQHAAVAGEYRSLARQEEFVARRLEAAALEQARFGPGWDAGRAIRGHRIDIAAQTRLQALSAARSAEEAASLARLHDSMATEGR